MTSEMLGHFFELERTCRGDDTLFVDLDARQIGGNRARSDHDVFGVDFGGTTVLGGHCYLARPGDRAGPPKRRDLVLFEQIFDAPGIGRNGIVLMGHHRIEIEFGRADLDPELGKVCASLFKHFRSMQQRLGGNAPDIEAGAAKAGPFLDHRDLHAQLGGAHRADIAPRARPDDGEIECFGHVEMVLL